MNGFEISTALDIKLGSTTVSAVYYGSTKLWPLAHDYSQDYLTFEALEPGTFTWTDTTNSNSISYSTDNGSTWSTLASGSSTPTIAANSKVLFKASGLTVSTSSGIGTFSSSGRFNAMGNIMSLVYGDNFANQTTINNNNQFCQLFKNSRIVDASNLILPAIILATYCYAVMFYGCTALTAAPELPAITLATNCYALMFYGCTALTAAPELPAITLATNCYNNMFGSCTALTTAPELPATTLSVNCYMNMFFNCSSLTTAPELPAITLVSSCYHGMFSRCSSLNYIKCLATYISAEGTTGWVNGVSNNGTFVRAANNTSWTIGDNGIPTGWIVDPPLTHDYSQDYLTFEPLEPGTFTWTDTKNNNSISYSIDDGSTWSTLASGSSTPTIATNSKVLFKASGLSVGSTIGIGTFSSTGTFNAMGNIMSLLYGDYFVNRTAINDEYQFCQLFKNSRIVDASNLILPATTLAPSCYREMFDSSELKITPKSLPATALASNCYRSMFGNCTSLITVMSILPAMTLSSDCYRYMFGGSSLTAAPELPATKLKTNCYNQMFSKCASLTTAPELPATSLAPNCYSWMFNSCTSLTTAPELPATKLETNCYNQMFRSCTLLNNVKCLATNISASNCTYNWLYSVAATGTFTKAASMTSWSTGVSGIPSGWTVVDAS